jgi:thiamine-phosphate pyrophosphorylase
MASLTDLARRLNLALVAMTDETRGGDPLALAARLPRGAWLIFRHYGHPRRAELAEQVAKICRARRVTLLIAGDAGLALRLRTGLHLPEGMARSARQMRRHPLTVAAHGRSGLIWARKLNADAALLSPVFPTLSHPGARPLGLLALRRLVRNSRVPVMALGGINEKTVRALRNTPIAGVAAIGALGSS